MLKLELITLDGVKFSEEVFEVQLPTPQGHIGIFPDHSPLVSIASVGIISVRRKQTDPDSKLEFFATNGGVVEIVDGCVRVLVDEADREDEINEQEALKAFERAQQLHRGARDKVSLDKAQALMDRHSVRLKVADLRRRNRRG
jgi:F-type H+-transporting ATPase subunit epsilon